MDNSAVATRSGDSDLELTQLQKGRVSFAMFMIIIVTYMMKDEVIYGEGRTFNDGTATDFHLHFWRIF